jgi:hypothetical protein
VLSVLLVLLANEVGRISRIAKGLSHLVLLDSFSHGRPRRHLALGAQTPLHKAASEVRYVVFFNNGSTTGW